jgi:NADPH:quinone reductase-like Zn-dependent oxidoreductase
MNDTTQTMKAVWIHAFGGPDRMILEDVPRPVPGPGQVLVRVVAAGVGPWDAWIREGKSVLPQPLPLVPGSDLSGPVEAVGQAVAALREGEDVFGVTNCRFTGAYAEYALAGAAMVARKPTMLSHPEAASLPVVASTAWQMLFDHAELQAGQRVLVLGGAGNVGAYAVQLAHLANAHVVATAFAHQAAGVQSLGAREIIDPQDDSPQHLKGQVDVVIDTVGGDALACSFELLRPGGILVSAVVEPDGQLAARQAVRAMFMLVSVNTAGLAHLAGLVEAKRLRTHVGEVLPLSQARTAHEMMAGRSHRSGKIVLLPGS